MATPIVESFKSQKLRRIASAVGREFSSALGQINAELASETEPLQKGKLLGQVAQTLSKRGKFQEASEAFGKAALAASPHARGWFPLEVAKIRSLVKAVSISEAQAAANECYATAEKKIQEFEAVKASASAELARTGKFTIPIRPLRLSVVASRLGEIFLSEGEIEIAKIFFVKALESNPRGGTRARQGLAEIALRKDDPEEGFQRAVEALTLGKYQAKTVSAWKLLFAAKRKLGQKGLPPELLASVKASHPSVRARATLQIVRELRSNGDDSWKTIANQWLSFDGPNYPSVSAELRKLTLADARSALKNPSQQIAAATQLLATSDLALHEWIAGAKEYVRASYFANQEPGIPGLLTAAAGRFGSKCIEQVSHSLALSCMEAKKHDVARKLLESAITKSAGSPGPIWSKSLWALGRMEAFLGNYGAASKAYGAVANASRVPQKFSLQARLLWAEALLKSGDLSAIKRLEKSLPKMLNGITDFAILLNFARQLGKLDGESRKISRQVFEMGRAQAVKIYESADHPSVAIDALFKLTRRELYDFGKFRDVIARWKSIPQERLLWMWTNNRQYWSYYALVSEAYLRARDVAGAVSVCGMVLNDPATPREALPIVGCPYYAALLKSGDIKKAISGFEWLIAEHPTAPGTAAAYYWLALHSYISGDSLLMSKQLQLLAISNARTEITYEQWKLKAKGLLLEADLKIENVRRQATEFDEEYLTEILDEINGDINFLG